MRFISLYACLFLATFSNGQSIIGAWERLHTSETGVALRSIVIFVDGYQTIASFDATSGKFVSTNGGTWQLKVDLMTETVEFDTKTPERVGSSVSFQVQITNETLEIVGKDVLFKKIDDGTPGDLKGAWLMSGRIVDEKLQDRDTSSPRKTMKILSGTRFQWIAYNTETKQFSGTGGGRYTTIDGVYTEHIEFFSRDDSRVGASLTFDYKMVDGNWHHSGLSSKGDPIYEIWSIRK